MNNENNENKENNEGMTKAEAIKLVARVHYDVERRSRLLLPILLIGLVSGLLLIMQSKWMCDMNNTVTKLQEEKEKKVVVEVVESQAQYTANGLEEELDNFKYSDKFYMWSNCSIRTVDDMIQDFSLVNKQLDYKAHCHYITNSGNYDLRNMDANQNLAYITSIFDSKVKHNVSRRVGKVLQNIQLDGQTVIEVGSYIVEYYDIQ